jgi:hypothetical protein
MIVMSACREDEDGLSALPFRLVHRGLWTAVGKAQINQRADCLRPRIGRELSVNPTINVSELRRLYPDADQRPDACRLRPATFLCYHGLTIH